MVRVNRLTHALMLAAVCNFPEIVSAQNIRESVRNHASRNPGEPYVRPAPYGDYSPKTIEDLAREASLVVQGRLKRVDTYLSANEDDVLTDYSILFPVVIAGRLPSSAVQTPGKTTSLVVTVNGGETVVEGVTVRVTDSQFDAIQDGAEYLLFLTPSGRALDRYEIYHGGVFEISRASVKPLLKSGDSIFRGTADKRLSDLISRVKGAKQLQ